MCDLLEHTFSSLFPSPTHPSDRWQTLYVGFQRSNILSQLIFQRFLLRFMAPYNIMNVVLQLEFRNQWWVPAMSCVVALCWGSIVDKKLGDGETRNILNTNNWRTQYCFFYFMMSLQRNFFLGSFWNLKK